MSPSSRFLRRILMLDAAISGVTALAFVLDASALAALLGVSDALLRYAGLTLIPFVLFVASLARREAISRASVMTVIALNIAWVAASLWLVLGSGLRPTTLGTAFIVAQAFVVALFAELQYVGLRRGNAGRRPSDLQRSLTSR